MTLSIEEKQLIIKALKLTPIYVKALRELSDMIKGHYFTSNDAMEIINKALGRKENADDSI